MKKTADYMRVTMGKKGKSGVLVQDRQSSSADRLLEIDLLKACAIISVILIHTLYTPILLLIGAPFHIWHAVPLFILIAGYTSAYAYIRRGSKTLESCYDPQLIWRRVRRILEPFIVMWVFQIAVIIILSGWIFTYGSLIQNFFLGGNGPGSYYIPVIIQHVLIVPILFLLALRYPRGMLAGAFILDLFLEILLYLSAIPHETYSILYVRYLFAGALGVYLAVSGPRFTAWTAAGGVIGFIYLTLTSYLGMFSEILNSNIEGGISHAPAYFWTLVLAVAGFLMLPKRAGNMTIRIFETFGKASWHIFLVQMTFFFFAWQWIQITILYPIQMLFPESINFLVIPVGATLTLAICCSVGGLWYLAGDYLQKHFASTP